MSRLAIDNMLVVVDMQNDFITGSLANPDAQAIVKPLCEMLEKGGYDMVFVTHDTHYGDYLDTQEGRRLPIPHCMSGTEGWEYPLELQDALDMATMARDGKAVWHTDVCKDRFGADWEAYYESIDPKTITLVGTCTDICVISNALILKELYPEARMVVYSNLCAGTTKENHEAALKVMRSCQIDVEEWRA